MFKEKDEMFFYALSGIAISVAFWGFGLFGLRAYPFAIPLMLAVYSLNFLLVYLFQAIMNEEKKLTTVITIGLCGALAFLVVIFSNQEKQVLGTLVLPIALMFIMPTVLYYIRETISKGGTDVQPK